MAGACVLIISKDKLFLLPLVSKSGLLQFKSVKMLGISQWKPAYFELRWAEGGETRSKP